MTLKGMGNTGSTLRAKETLWRCIVIWKLTEVGKWYQEMIPHHHITLSVMKEPRSQLSFTQLWFCCSKKQGRMFHVTTVSNSTVEAVVQYFSDQTDVPPDSCGSFQRMEDDNSKSVMECVSCNYQGKETYSGLCGSEAVQICHIRSTQVSLASIIWILVLRWPVF